MSWLLRYHLPECAIQSEWADLGSFPNPPNTLEDRITDSLKYYPCDVLFIHRDADNQGRLQRLNEIKTAVSKTVTDKPIAVIPVIPVRMTEAWLLFDESAIRIAADNPGGSQTLALPKLKNAEGIADPKDFLQCLLRQANGASGRRLKKFNARLSSKVQRIAEITDDFSSLRELDAFTELEKLVSDFARRTQYS
ncbi:MAG: hypothetical protein AAF716_05725 [Cyanobacteria bacterium P01_D01_bin.1]